MPSTDQIAVQLDRLAEFDAGPFSVVSLYLNLQPDSRGRDLVEPFLRKELGERIRTYPAEGPERASLTNDVERIRAYVSDIDPSANGLALFTCSGANLFETVILAAPIDQHRLYISNRPHLYPLARVLDAYRRFAVLLANTNSARLFVVAGNTLQKVGEVEGIRTRRHDTGGWSQARYQRHIDNYHLLHAKEVADTLARVVRDERLDTVIVAGDEVIVPLLKEHFPKDVAERVVDVLKLDAHAGEREVLDATMAAMRQNDAETDRERVDALLDGYRANGLACVGVDATRRALEKGQVDELVITAVPGVIDASAARTSAGETGPAKDGMTAQERIADKLVALAHRTSAKIRFIEDAALLAPVGGAGAFLRYKL